MYKITNTLLAVVLGLFAPACAVDTSAESSAESSAGEVEDGFCTLIGCVDGVTANWDGALKQSLGELPYTVDVCLNDRCTVAVLQAGDTALRGCTEGACCTVDREGSVSCDADERTGNVTFFFDLDAKDVKTSTAVVSLRATDAFGREVFADQKHVLIGSFQPNGPACEPTCYSGKVTFGGKG